MKIRIGPVAIVTAVAVSGCGGTAPSTACDMGWADSTSLRWYPTLLGSEQHSDYVNGTSYAPGEPASYYGVSRSARFAVRASGTETVYSVTIAYYGASGNEVGNYVADTGQSGYTLTAGQRLSGTDNGQSPVGARSCRVATVDSAGG